MLSANIEDEVKDILVKKGEGGWLRVAECAKEFGKDPETRKRDKSRETKFYRFRRKVEKGNVKGLQVVGLPKNISYIGLKSADPRVIESILCEDKKISQSIKSGLGFWEYLERQKLRAEQKRDKGIRELEAEADALAEIMELNEDECTKEKVWSISEKWRKRYALKRESTRD